MAKYEVRCDTCGAQFTRQLFGPEKQRHFILTQPQTCGTCYRKCQQEERVALTAQAVTESADRGLVALIGSDKQNAWAYTIRQKALKACDELTAIIRKHDAVAGGEVEALIWEAVNARAESRWWIDNRFDMERYREALVALAGAHQPLADYLRSKGVQL